MNVIFEDNHLLVVEKPYGVPSQADQSGDADMLNLCKAYIKRTYAKPGAVYLGLVHRLDRPTSGVMVFARTSKAAARLSAQLRSGSFEKTYLAVLVAPPPQDTGTLWHHLVKDQGERVARVAGEGTPGAKKAGLEYAVMGHRDGLWLVRVRLLTGRFHQIRAQFAAMGCGVYGDMKYGGRDVKARLALYAAQVRFDHPTTGEKLCFSLTPTRHPFDLFDIPQGG